MPTEMPSGREPAQSVAVPPPEWLPKVLNWMAVFVGLGLCFWALNYGVIATSYSNSPSSSGSYSTHE